MANTLDGARLRALRETKLMTMAELSRRCGVSVHTLWRAERRNCRPGNIILLKIAAALGVDVDKIVDAPTVVSR